MRRFSKLRSEALILAAVLLAGGAVPAFGMLVIEGNVWTYPWEDTENGKTTYFRVVNMFTNKIEFRQEYSTDQQNWTLMSKGTEVKQWPYCAGCEVTSTNSTSSM